MKIKTKLHISFILTALMVSISLMSVVYFSLLTHFEKHEGERLQENVTQAAKSIDRFMFSREDDFHVLTNNPLFSLASHESVSDYLSRITEHYPFYE